MSAIFGFSCLPDLLLGEDLTDLGKCSPSLGVRSRLMATRVGRVSLCGFESGAQAARLFP